MVFLYSLDKYSKGELMNHMVGGRRLLSFYLRKEIIILFIFIINYFGATTGGAQGLCLLVLGGRDL